MVFLLVLLMGLPTRMVGDWTQSAPARWHRRHGASGAELGVLSYWHLSFWDLHLSQAACRDCRPSIKKPPAWEPGARSEGEARVSGTDMPGQRGTLGTRHRLQSSVDEF